MELLARLAAWSVLAFSVLLFASQLLAHWVGHVLGQRERGARGTGEAEGVGLVVGGLLGLLAFILALTLSYGSTRFHERRAGALAEANAIGTAWLRAEALDHPRAHQIARLLEGYTSLRKEFMLAPRRSSEIDTLNQRTAALQTEIWGHVTAISRERYDPVVVSLMAALNETFDLGTAERFAFEKGMPGQLFWLLIGMALLCMASLGYQLGLKGQKTHRLTGLLIAVWTAVIVVILDLSSPRLGAFRTSVDVYDWTLQGFKGGIRIPALPAD